MTGDDWTPPGWVIALGEKDPNTGWRNTRLKCRAPSCHYTSWTFLPPGSTTEKITGVRHLRDHQCQHRPDRALDIAVDWEVSALCSVCEDGIGNVRQDADGLTCQECGTYWSIDGTDGYRDEEKRDD